MNLIISNQDLEDILKKKNESEISDYETML